MDSMIASLEEDYASSTTKAYIRTRDLFEKWRGDKVYSEVLISNFIQCYLKGTKNMPKNEGTIDLSPHRADSTKTMLSHLNRYLKDHVHFELSESCLSIFYRFLGSKERIQGVHHAQIFSVEEIASLYKMPTETMTQTRDLLIFAIGICTLARSAELISLKVEDIQLKPDGLIVVIHRVKACASRTIQQIWVSGTFFGWNLLDNMRRYMDIIPASGPLWRRIPPSPKNVMDFAALAPTTIESTPQKMAVKLKLQNPKSYHSHSMRRTGATLLAMAGRSEEQIKTMGNWTSVHAIMRYIENSEVTMRANGRALAMPDFIVPNFKDATPTATSAAITTPAKSVAPTVTEPDAAEPNAVVLAAESTVQTLDRSVQLNPSDDDNSDKAFPPPTKKKCGGIVFSGAINQVIVVNSLDDASRFCK